MGISCNAKRPKTTVAKLLLRDSILVGYVAPRSGSGAHFRRVFVSTMLSGRLRGGGAGWRDGSKMAAAVQSSERGLEVWCKPRARRIPTTTAWDGPARSWIINIRRPDLVTLVEIAYNHRWCSPDAASTRFSNSWTGPKQKKTRSFVLNPRISCRKFWQNTLSKRRCPSITTHRDEVAREESRYSRLSW